MSLNLKTSERSRVSDSGWLFLQFFRREISNRFAGSVLGGFWAFLHPIALLIVYGFIFSAVFKVSLPQGNNIPFLLFVAVALWPWQAFQDGVLRGLSAVTANAPLVKKVAFSHELLVYASVSGSFTLHILGYLIALFLISLWGYSLKWHGLPLAISSLMGMYLLAMGLALIGSALHVFVRDLEQGLTHVFALLFYLSPVVYSGAMVPHWLSSFMAFNPLAILIDSIRNALLTGRNNPTTAEALTLGFCLFVALMGRSFFSRLSPHFEEAL